MKRPETLELVRVGVHAVIETNRTDRQLVPQTRADRVAHIVQPNVFGARQKVSGVGENSALQFAENRECVFDIEHGKKFSTDRMPVIIVRAKIAFAETAHCCSSAIEKALVDRNFGRFAGAAGCKRMNNSDTSAKSDRGLPEPPFKTTADGLIFNYARREGLRSKWQIITNAHRAADEFDVAAERTWRQIDGVADKKTTGVNVRTFAKIERVC